MLKVVQSQIVFNFGSNLPCAWIVLRIIFGSFLEKFELSETKTLLVLGFYNFGGRVTFKKKEKSSTWIFKVTKVNSFGLDVGVELEVKGEESEEAAIGNLAARFSTTETEIRQSTVSISSIISDGNKYSELHVFVDYNGTNNGTIRWGMNDLNLKYTRYWEKDSELIVKITF